GNSPRLYRNALVFLAVDRLRLQDLEAAIRRFLAWDSIWSERESLELTSHQARQAEAQRKAEEQAVLAQLPESYQWLLVPTQDDARAPVRLEAIRLQGAGALAERASARLLRDEKLIT